MGLENRLANVIRVLAMDAVQTANSGHPGMPMGMADIAEVLWREFVKHSPESPRWPDRDRFVLSNGHGSMLLYAVLHLTGYPLSVEDLKQFRQLGSHTAGHPEVDPQRGIETTTGPLGQGLANAVGMAMAERLLAERFNQPGLDIVDHHTYVFLGDGCLMEGISHEAASLAGTWRLGKLIALYDDNGISIDGEVEGWFTDDTPKRFEAYGWQVIKNVDGHDREALKKAIRKARNDPRPSLICCKTIIGLGAPNKQGKESCHGAPLGAAEVASVRQALGWSEPAFVIPEDVRVAWDAKAKGRRVERKWQKLFKEYRKVYPELAREFERRMAGELVDGFEQWAAELTQQMAAKPEAMATRVASQHALNHLVTELPELLGGSADLTGSNNTAAKTSQWVKPGSYAGNYLSYGVREFGMTAIMNGLSLHGGFRPYGGTFLVFSDYARNAIRMAALMGQPVINVLTHDSIGLGEDGPTHQPIEQVASLRLIPNHELWRPCDASETWVAWVAALKRRSGPTSLILSRQNLPAQHRSRETLGLIERGGYTLAVESGALAAIILATGSEVAIAMEAQRQLAAMGHAIRVVSLPCVERFMAQPDSYREQVLPAGVTVLGVEAGVRDSLALLTGSPERVLGMQSFGASAPAPQLYQHFGITAEHLVQLTLKHIG